MGVLQGTFDTLALPEVLGLLAQSRKTGALWLRAGTAEGRVYLADGRCCAAESDTHVEPVATDRDLDQRLVDVCFELARQDDGSFRFVVDDEPTWRVGGAGVAIEDAVGSLERLLEEWREIQAVIPTLDVRLQLTPELGTDSIIIDQPRWRLLVALDGNRSVRDVMSLTERGVLDVCNALKELIEEGAVEVVGAPVPAGDVAPETEPEAIEAVEAVEAVEERAAELLAHDAPIPEVPDPFAEDDIEDEPVTDDPETIAAVDRALEEGDPRDRGALLRLFSALREP
jgi:hypothetical protein